MDDKSRIDIKMRNVFISWTGSDCALKDKIVARLVAGNITCTVSDGKSSDGMCAGNFVQWSANAAKSANVFLLVLTENTLKSAYVPLEIKEFLSIDDAENRMIVVCPSLALWNNAVFQYNGEQIKLSNRNISIIEMPNCELTEQILESIYIETTSLINNRAYTVYQEEIKPKYIDVMSLYSDDAPDRKLSFDDLYINRQVTEKDETGQVVATHTTPANLVAADDILYICGPAGSGKTQYIHQIQNCASESSVVITLPCSKIATSTKTLREQMFDEFCRVLGNPIYFSLDNFVNLLNNKRLVLVLDGLDEIATQAGVRTFVKKVEDEYYARHNAQTTLFVTGRDENGAKRIALSGKTVRTLYLDRLTEQESQTLGNNLFLAFGSSDKRDGFFVRIKDLQDEIKYNPLLLSQLAVIYKENGDVPQTVVGIFDAISKITLNIDTDKNYTGIRASYLDMLYGISSLLKRFAQRRYIAQSNDERCSPQEIFEELLFKDYKDDYSDRAKFLVDFLVKRSILVDNGNDFYHKMFLEYFTAVYYYERSILRRRVADFDELTELFSHYSDPYWTQVITLFLVKADSLMNGAEMRNLYLEAIKAGNICDYTVLLEACDNLVNNKQTARVTTVYDILKKSAEKIYPPYGPLFWYIPTYSLYEETLLALETLQGNAEALALTRDVCYIFGQKNNVSDCTDKVDGKALFAAARELAGVRKALCEIFYLGDTSDANCGGDIFPRCFNVAETISFRDNSCGIGGRMTTPFNDELGLYSHESYNELNGEYMGFISCPYNKEQVETKLNSKATRHVTGIAYSPTDANEFSHPSFYDRTVIRYLPENLKHNGAMIGEQKIARTYNNRTSYLCNVSVSNHGILYLYGDVIYPFPDTTVVPQDMFFFCNRLHTIKLPSNLTEIGESAFEGSGLTKICLPQSITTLGNRAFRKCRNLTEIAVPDGVTQINEGLFNTCDRLEAVKLPRNLQKISDSAFFCCEKLQQIDIPDTVTEIGKEAFSYCTELKNVTIPDGVTQISENCFGGCENLEEIVLPPSIISLDVGAFLNCSKLRQVQLPNATEIGTYAFAECTALQNVSLGPVTTIGMRAFYNCESLTTLTIPTTLQKLGTEAFANSGITSVTLPHGLDSIKRGVFKECIYLQEVTLPDTLTSIDGSAFMSCLSLVSVDIPASVTFISGLAFAGCELLRIVNLHHGLTTIIGDAFVNCKSLLEINIPDSVTQLGGSFSNCTSLVKVHLPQGLKTIAPRSFSNCAQLSEINIPDTVTEIKDHAFHGCSSLKTIDIPQSVHSIGQQAFSCCASLEEINIPDAVTEISCGTFENCSQLKAIDVPQSVRKIESSAFAGCKNLQTVQLHEGLTLIAERAFENCAQLKSLVIPNSVNEVRHSVFYNCEKLKELTVPQKLQNTFAFQYPPQDCHIHWVEGEHDVLKLPDGITEVTPDIITNRNVTQIILPQSVVSIADDAFRNCGYLTNVNIPKSVKRIGNSAFADCSNLKKLFLYDAVTTIGDRAFENCRNLEELYIPDNVTDIGKYAFSGCYNLKKLRLSANLKIIHDGLFKGCYLSDLVIPEGVTEIGNNAFEDCRIFQLVLPTTLTKMGENVFTNCAVHQGVTIPSGVKTISTAMFSNSLVTHVTLSPGVEKIGENAFRECYQLAKVEIPDSVKVICEGAFFGCAKLLELDIPDSVTELELDERNYYHGIFNYCGMQKIRLSRALKFIPHHTFKACNMLEEIDIPRGVTAIDWYAFAECHNLRVVNIPDTVQSIQDGAFKDCASLEEIVIPDSVTELGSNLSYKEKYDELGVATQRYDHGVFENCENLKKIHLPINLPQINERTFYNCRNLSEIDIPANVKYIKNLAFKGCANLKTVTIHSSMINIADDAFAETCLETLTISRNFEHDVERIFGNNKPKKINYI